MSAVTDSINGAARRVPPWVIYLGGAAYAGWQFWRGINGQLGPDPVNKLEHIYGEAALYLLVAGLAVTPLRERLRINLLRFRRAIGVTCFGFAAVHLAVYALLDVQSLGRVWADVVKRPYITVGMLAFVLLLPLAVTSNNLSLRRLGGVAWRQLHKLVYPAAILVGLHWLWLAKGFRLEPILWLTAILLLLALRIRPARRFRPA